MSVWLIIAAMKGTCYYLYVTYPPYGCAGVQIVTVLSTYRITRYGKQVAESGQHAIVSLLFEPIFIL
jgi:hypothetical protein